MQTSHVWRIVQTTPFFLLLFLFGCVANESLGSAENASPTPSDATLNATPFTLVDCTPADDTTPALSISLQEDRYLIVSAYNIPPEQSATIVVSAEEADDVLEMRPEAHANGVASTAFTLPNYDYMRWNISLLHGETVHCQYVIVSGDELLEAGYQGLHSVPAGVTHQSAEEALMQDAAMVAESMGIPIEEVLLSSELEDEVSKLDARLRVNESKTYAGLRIEWQPRYHIVVTFTSEAEATLANYVGADHPLAAYVEADEVGFSSEQLEADQAVLMQMLESADFPWGTALMHSQGLIELSVPTSEIWETFRDAQQIELPPSVIVTYAFDEIPAVEPPTGVIVAENVYMAKLIIPDMAHMQALNNDVLTVRDGCLFAGDALIIWQPGYFPVEQDERIVIVNEHNKVVATEGETLYLGGGFTPRPTDDALVEPIPAACDAPEIFRMGDFLPDEYRTSAVESADHFPIYDRVTRDILEWDGTGSVTIRARTFREGVGGYMPRAVETLPALQDETLDGYHHVNRGMKEIGAAFAGHPEYVFAYEGEELEVESLHFSDIGFNQARDQALLLVCRDGTGTDFCAIKRYVLLEKSAEEWQIIDQVTIEQ